MKKPIMCRRGARNFFRLRILLDQDILAGKHAFDDFAFEVDEHGRLELTDDGKDVIEERRCSLRRCRGARALTSENVQSRNRYTNEGG